MLTEDEFNTLVTGGIITDKLTKTKIALKDIGWDLMIKIIERAQAQ